jgi:hypothetical protein
MSRLDLRLVVIPALICVAAATGGCGDKEAKEAKAPMTEAQRDSAIAASKLPGAGVVGKALSAADSAKARAEREDEASGASDTDDQ